METHEITVQTGGPVLINLAGNPASYRLGIPLGKVAEPEGIAKATAFLLSDDASHITVHDRQVDGGATLNQMR